MDAAALAQAKTSLAKCRVSAQRLQESVSFEETSDAWADFLLATSGIYSKLEQGVKGYNKSRSWFDLVKKERKQDGLVRYLHLARNADEHGIKPTTTNTGKIAGFQSSDGQWSDTSMLVIQGDILVHSFEEQINNGPFTPFERRDWRYFAVLKRAHDDRFNDFCDPPTSHEGKDILIHSPVEAAITAIPYLERLILVAEYYREQNAL